MKRQGRVKQSFLHGAAILVGAMIVVKLFGVLFKIPLANILGEVGCGYFNTAYSIFTPIYTLSVAGLPTAVSKLVAEKNAFGAYRDVRKILRIANTVFWVFGILGSVLLFVMARPLAQLVKNPNAYASIVAMAPAIFFGCIIASYRGYYEGLQNMKPTAISQIVEVVIKLICGLGLSFALVRIGMAQYAQGQAVFGQVADNSQQAWQLMMPIAAAGAIVGVSISTLGGTAFLWMRHTIVGDGITKRELQTAPMPQNTKALLKRLVKMAIPIAVASLVLNITTLIDVATIMRRLAVALENGRDILLAQYGAHLPTHLPDSEIPNFIYGAYSGFAVSVFTLVPSFTGVFGKSALPGISAAWAGQNRTAVKRSIESVIRMTGLVAIPAGLGIFAMAKPILELLFPAQPDAVYIAAPVLQYMGIGVIFLSLATPLFSILQAIGRADIPVKLMLWGSLIKIASNYLLVAIPQVNIKGAPLGTILCYGLILVWGLVILCRLTRVKLNIKQVFVKPIFASVVCAGSAFGVYRSLSPIWNCAWITLFSIVIGGCFYAFSLIVIKGIAKDDIFLLPKGEKIAKRLEKIF